MFDSLHSWTDYVPLLVFAVLMLWRLRSLDRARPLRIAMLWVLPALILTLAGLALLQMHPGGKGWLVLTAGVLVGGMVGAQRARLLRLHVEGKGAGARVMMRNSPAAIILLLAIFGLRRLLMPGYHPVVGDHPGMTALLATDAMLGFAIGVVCVQRLLIWRRARALIDAHAAMAG